MTIPTLTWVRTCDDSLVPGRRGEDPTTFIDYKQGTKAVFPTTVWHDAVIRQTGLWAFKITTSFTRIQEKAEGKENTIEPW
jgi:hypothetical protein